MSNTNIYDIVISEEVARQDGLGETLPGGGPKLIISMDASTTMSVNTPIQNPINVTSSIQNMPLGWEVATDSHVIYVETYGGPPVGTTPSSNISETFVDSTGSLPAPTAVGVVVKEYYSQVIIYELANPSNTLVLPTSPNNIRLQTASSVYYGLLNADPTAVSQLTPTVSDTFSVPSNNAYQGLYISVPNTEAQPVAIKDEHGLISNISDYPIVAGLIPNYNTYKYQWPVKLTGNYTHTFTLIYS